jgi:hypothetical protein
MELRSGKKKIEKIVLPTQVVHNIYDNLNAVPVINPEPEAKLTKKRKRVCLKKSIYISVKF